MLKDEGLELDLTNLGWVCDRGCVAGVCLMDSTDCMMVDDQGVLGDK